MADKDSGSEMLKPNQVCARLDIQPYQLKFWEAEFGELGNRVGARREYDEVALQVALDVKRLLVDGRMNLGEAREILRERYAAESGEAEVGAAADLPARGEEPEPVPALDETAQKPDQALRRRLRRAEEAALQARQRASMLEAELEDLRRDLEENGLEARRTSMHERGRVTELSQLLDEARARIAELEEKLGKERSRTSSGKESRVALETELGEARAALDEALGARAALEGRLEAANAQLLDGAREAESLRRLLREEGGALESEAGRLAGMAEELLVSLSWAGHPSAEASVEAPEAPEATEASMGDEAAGGAAKRSKGGAGKAGEEARGRG